MMEGEYELAAQNRFPRGKTTRRDFLTRTAAGVAALATCSTSRGALAAGDPAIGRGKLAFTASGKQFSFDTGSRDDDSAVAARASAGAGGTIKAPMPGNVVKVMVAEGDEVSVGTSLVVVEAMKMENEVRSPVDGVVRKVNVAAGDSVGTTEAMIEIEPAE